MAYNNSEKAVLKTIIYSDIFGFPLSKEELWQFLISSKKVERQNFENALTTLRTKISSKNGLYCLLGNENNITTRLKNAAEVPKKMRLAKYAAYILSHIPTILFIGLSGGAAMGDVDAEDDIDVFIITKRGKLFSTRFLILILLELLGLRRSRTDYHPANKICVNLLIDETNLSWPEKKHDLYVAREIVQMKPMFDRNGTYKKFMVSNQWVKDFFPNVHLYPVVMVKTSHYFINRLVTWLFTCWPIEYFMRYFQTVSIKRNQTREVISHQFLAFHPRDYREKILRMYEKKLKQVRVTS